MRFVRAFTTSGFALAVLCAACAPGTDDRAPDAGVDLPSTLAIGPVEVAGSTDRGPFVADAFLRSVRRSLSGISGLTLLPGAPAPGEPAVVLHGRIERVDAAVRAVVELRDASTGEIVHTSTTTSETGDLARVAACVGRDLTTAVGVEAPRRYLALGNLACGDTSPEATRIVDAISAWRRNDLDAYVGASASLVEERPDALRSQLLHATALAISWDSAPTEDTMAALQDRLSEMGRVDPDNPYTDLLLAYSYRSSGVPDRAEKLCGGLLTRNDLGPSARAWVLRQRSYASLQTGDAESARRDAERAIDLDAASGASHFALSRALEAQGDLDGAIESSRNALALEPASWRFHLRVGLVLARMDRLDEAVRHVARSCELSARQDACANAAVTMLRAGLRAEASAAAEHARSLTASAWGLYNLACYEALAGERDTALASLRRALDVGFADHLISTDSDLDSLRGAPEFEQIVVEATSRFAKRRELALSGFPWQ